MSDKDWQWATLIAYARGAGAGGYGTAATWAAWALEPPPLDMAEAFRRIDEFAAPPPTPRLP